MGELLLGEHLKVLLIVELIWLIVELIWLKILWILSVIKLLLIILLIILHRKSWNLLRSHRSWRWHGCQQTNPRGIITLSFTTLAIRVTLKEVI